MWDFLAEQYSTIIVCAIIAVLMLLAIRKIVRDRRNGKRSCGGDCANCLYRCSGERKNGTKDC